MAYKQQPGFQRRITMPPPTGNQALDEWLRNFAISHNNEPRMSWFSGTTPNSNITGTAGDIVVNLASGSTVSRFWIMTGAPSYITNLGWKFLSVGGS